MKMLATLSVMLCLTGCSTLSDFMFGPDQDITANQRLLIVCEGWNSAFRRINDRDMFGMATEAEVKAVDTALLVINPFCTQDLLTAQGFDIQALERALVQVLTAGGDEA